MRVLARTLIRWNLVMVRVYSVFDYGTMILDRVRTDAYSLALRHAVKPGSVVLDIGTGTGIFALMACRFGARRVYAIEPSDVIQLAREISASNGCASQIEFIEDSSTQVTLPEQADVIIADVHGVLPETHVPIMIDARERLLAPGGILIPQRDTMWAAVVDVPALYGRHADPWDQAAHGLDMSAARRMVMNSSHRSGRPKLTPEQFLVDPCQWAELDYTRVESAELAADLRWTAVRPGTGHGLIVWFDSTLAEGIGFSNTPLGPGLVYGSLFLPWSEPVTLDVGDTVSVTLKCKPLDKDLVWCWYSRVTGAGGPRQVKADFRQSEFFGEPLSPERLRRQEAGHLPRLNEEGEVDRFLLTLFDGTKPLGEIAREASLRFPDRFPQWKDALTRVATLAGTYGR
jgi:protein arginine N-methyltransferase 1